MIVSIENAKISALRVMAAELIERAAQYGIELVIEGKKTMKSTFIAFIAYAQKVIAEAARGASKSVNEFTGCDLTGYSVEFFCSVCQAVMFVLSEGLKVARPVVQTGSQFLGEKGLMVISNGLKVWQFLSSERALDFYWEMAGAFVMGLLLCVYGVVCAGEYAWESGQKARQQIEEVTPVVVRVYTDARDLVVFEQGDLSFVGLHLATVSALIWRLDDWYQFEIIVPAMRIVRVFPEYAKRQIRNM
ncbi:hypothetical protein ACQ4M3_19150 [Leptolyngbya sp. AN03gr2]|uniref:hypothetical protein n=1 Tax=Leptolyngbya sp. AN03gr2 TaxID=3423364 RepID=UPI003D322182